MVRIYRTGTGTRLVNLVFQVMARLGLGNGDRHVLSVVGRETGKPHSTPVDVMEQGGRRWLVAPTASRTGCGTPARPER